MISATSAGRISKCFCFRARFRPGSGRGVSRTRAHFPFLIVNIPFLLLLVLGTASCDWFHHPRPRARAKHVDGHKLAARLRAVVAEAGGRQIWIKCPANHRQGESSQTSLEVLANPRGYAAVVSAVQQESHRDKLHVEASRSQAESGLPSVQLNITNQGQSVFQIHLREVPRLLRAAIVIDDMGQDLEAAHRLLSFGYPLTFSVLPHLRYTQQTAQAAHLDGREVMLHLPMEPEAAAHASPGEGAILVGMGAGDVRRAVEGDLASVPFVAGVNNHMGSRATADPALMAEVMRVLASRRVYFIDSRTTAASVALAAAQRQGVPAFYRSVFLDDVESVPYTLGQLRQFRHVVEQEGIALAIGHPHSSTISALAEFLPEFERAGIELVTPSEIVHLPETAQLHPHTVR